MSNILYNSIKIYLLIIILLIFIRPNFIFDKKNNKFKSFGIKKNHTIFSLPILSILIAFGTYLFFYIINKSKINTNTNINTNNQSIPPIREYIYYPPQYPQYQLYQQYPLYQPNYNMYEQYSQINEDI
jgi:hypothetical protein